VVDQVVERAEELARDLLAGSGRRWLHVQAVAARAAELAVMLPPADRSRVVAAAWLHDIGYAPTVARTGFHPLDAAIYLDSLGGFEPVIVRLVAHHSGASVEAEERGLASALSEYLRPRVDLLDVLTAADMTVGPDGMRVSAEARLTEILHRYANDDPVHRAVY
jgi:HD superfamily phosphodiesterase